MTDSEFIFPCCYRKKCSDGMVCAAHLAEGRAFACFVKTEEDFNRLEHKCEKQYDYE